MDYYKILGIDRNASPDEIKKAYRKMASMHHPDKGGDTAMFQQIEQAYRTLSDPEAKAQYDNPPSNMNWHHQGPGGFSFGAGPDINTIFEHIFGQRGGNPFAQQRNNRQVFRTQIVVSLEDAYNGATHMMKIQTPVEQKIVNIDIPKGVQTGSQIRYDNLIDNASLVLEYKISPHLKFERRDNDLYCNHKISVLDLIVGTKFNFISLSGKEFEVNVTPKTQPYMQLKIPGQGMPIQNTNHFGDQIILLKPYIPDTIDDEITQSILRSKSK